MSNRKLRGNPVPGTGSRKLGSDPDVERLRRIAEAAGWTVKQNNRSHLVWTSPPNANGDRQRHTSALTFKDKRRIKKIEKFLREAGVNV